MGSSLICMLQSNLINISWLIHCISFWISNIPLPVSIHNVDSWTLASLCCFKEACLKFISHWIYYVAPTSNLLLQTQLHITLLPLKKSIWIISVIVKSEANQGRRPLRAFCYRQLYLELHTQLERAGTQLLAMYAMWKITHV